MPPERGDSGSHAEQRDGAASLADAALTRVAREEGGRVLALLAHRLGDLDLADEALQDALAAAATRWPVDGVPDNPPAWLLTVARRRAVDRLRRAAAEQRRAEGAAQVHDEGAADGTRTDLLLDDVDGPVADERLRLILLCCHPALDRDTQVVLTARLVAGLTVPEIAAALLTAEATVAQRIVRAKRKIRDARIPLAIPADLRSRVDAVLSVLYLLFNEGYLSRGGGDGVVRVDLVDESVRLTEVLASVLPEPDPEVLGLLALQHFHRARLDTRVDAHGDLVLLADQDRLRWDLAEIRVGNAVLAEAMRLLRPGPYQVQALIASHHANARTADDTDWVMIVALYEQLVAMTGSPVVRVNHAVAVSMADGPDAGLRLLHEIDDLSGYHLYHAALAELTWRSGRPADALAHFATATDLTANERERRHLERRAAACRADLHDTDGAG